MRAVSFSGTMLERDSTSPLYRQIYDLIRLSIHSGRLSGGQRLAATRVLADDLGVSRNTVLEAVEQLLAEGYLTARVGAGTFVAENLPEASLRRLDEAAAPAATALPPLSRRGERIHSWPTKDWALKGRPFRPGPEVDLFPWSTWRRLATRRSRELGPSQREVLEGQGYRPLREQLARRLWETRGVACSVDQILLVRGSQQGLELAARVLLDEGDEMWLEDPSYPGARRTFEAAGAHLVPVAVDDEGLSVDEGLEKAPRARMAYVTPSHHYPLGMTMTVKRRLELLDWAQRTGSWIVEDDYDGGFRYDGRPLASLASVDRGRHVIYVGTFSRLFFPALRLGYIVVPAEHVGAFVAARSLSDPGSFALEHRVVEDFMAEGHADRHMRRMRQLYKHRQEVLARAVHDTLDAGLELQTRPAGLHAIGWLREGHAEDRIVRRAAAAGVHVEGVSTFCLESRQPAGLLLGFAAYPEEKIVRGVEKLREVLEDLDEPAHGESH